MLQKKRARPKPGPKLFSGKDLRLLEVVRLVALVFRRRHRRLLPVSSVLGRRHRGLFPVAVVRRRRRRRTLAILRRRRRGMRRLRPLPVLRRRRRWLRMLVVLAVPAVRRRHRRLLPIPGARRRRRGKRRLAFLAPFARRRRRRPLPFLPLLLRRRRLRLLFPSFPARRRRSGRRPWRRRRRPAGADASREKRAGEQPGKDPVQHVCLPSEVRLLPLASGTGSGGRNCVEEGFFRKFRRWCFSEAVSADVSASSDFICVPVPGFNPATVPVRR